MTIAADEFTIDSVYPWGRSFDEYADMFALSCVDLGKRILGCADGPSSFNREMTQRGNSVISCIANYEFLRGANEMLRVTSR